MATKPALDLCYGASPRKCHRCFPEHSPQAFLLRELWLKRFLREVDEFISPSEFLCGRYIEWGLPPEKIRVHALLPVDLPRRAVHRGSAGQQDPQRRALGGYGRRRRRHSEPAVWFALHTWFRKAVQVQAARVSFDIPVPSSLDPWALALLTAAVLAIFRFKMG